MRFYRDLRFDLAWSDHQLAYFLHGGSSFLLQNFYEETQAANFMMHVDAWWTHIEAKGVPAAYGVKAEPPEDRPWGLRDFVLVDPGVLWRVGQTIGKAPDAS